MLAVKVLLSFTEMDPLHIRRELWVETSEVLWL
jgi:hypothetical protein